MQSATDSQEGIMKETIEINEDEISITIEARATRKRVS